MAEAFKIKDGVLEKYNGEDKEVVIPDGIKVIDAFAFANKGITSVKIPDGTVGIGNLAFNGCTSLISVTLPDSLKWIGDSAFFGCRNLEEINIPDGIKLAGSVFFECKKLSLKEEDGALYLGNEKNPYVVLMSVKDNTVTEFKIKEGVSAVNDSAFCCFRDLQSVECPVGLKSISNNAFDSCEKLREVAIPDSVECIGDRAFAFCNGLESVSLGKALNEIGGEAFTFCTALKSVTVSADNKRFISKNNCLICNNGKAEADGSLTVANRSLLFAWGKEVVIPEEVDEIESRAFTACGGLTEIIVPDNVENIREKAFWDCKSLEKVELPATLKLIGGKAFEYSDNLKTVVYRGTQEEWEKVNKSSFDLESYKDIDWDDGAPEFELKFGDDLEEEEEPEDSKNFYVLFGVLEKYKGDRKTVTIPDGVYGIKAFAFEGTPAEFVNIPESLCKIEDKAFENSKVKFEEHENALYLGDEYHPYLAVVKAKNRDIEACNLHLTARIIGDHAFEHCRKLKSVVLTDGVTHLGEYAFQCCGFEEINLPDSIEFIGDGCFASTQLKSITIPRKVDKISDYAFGSCTELKHVEIHEGVTTIDESAFEDCSALESIYLGDSVDSIGFGAFSNCKELKTVTMGAKVLDIGENVFEGCEKLTDVAMSDSVREIGKNAFENCKSLKRITLSKSLKKIGSEAFKGCSELECITLYDGVTNIESSAFRGCDKLKMIEFHGNKKVWKGLAKGCMKQTAIGKYKVKIIK